MSDRAKRLVLSQHSGDGGEVLQSEGKVPYEIGWKATLLEVVKSTLRLTSKGDLTVRMSFAEPFNPEIAPNGYNAFYVDHIGTRSEFQSSSEIEAGTRGLDIR